MEERRRKGPRKKFPAKMVINITQEMRSDIEKFAAECGWDLTEVCRDAIMVGLAKLKEEKEMSHDSV